MAERFLDEGLASAFSRAVAPDADNEDILGIHPAAVQWLEEHGEELLHHRLHAWDFTQTDPPLEWVRDAPWHEEDRSEPPWTLDHAPSRWGYYVGEKFFARAQDGDWIQQLTQAAPSLRILTQVGDIYHKPSTISIKESR